MEPFAFVVSSGDSESHVHPRPDLLGRLGRHGRGDAPLILCTEILRSSREMEDETLLKRLQRLDSLIEDSNTSAENRKSHREDRARVQKELAKRNVEVYGAITVRTDGKNLVVAFRMERERSGRSPKRWQTYWYRHNEARGFVPVANEAH